MKAHRGGLSRQPRTPRVKPAVDLTLELIRTDQMQQRTGQHFGDRDQQLTRVIVIDQGIKGLKIATQIARDEREGPYGQLEPNLTGWKHDHPFHISGERSTGGGLDPRPTS